VVERGDDVVAWAGAGPYRSREAYSGVAEHSVYTARHARGIGAGRAALDGLIREYEARGFWKLVSRIVPENRASLILHQRAGFRVVGVYRRHGRLAGEWRDCVIVERLLGRGGPRLNHAAGTSRRDAGRSGRMSRFGRRASHAMTLNRGVAAMCAGQACAQIGAFSVAALLPTLIAAWSLRNTEAGWISGIYYSPPLARSGRQT
jgi:hypothetical protein